VIVPGYEISEVTLESVDQFYDELEAIYRDEEAVLCPQGNGAPPILSREDASVHLDYGRRMVVAHMGGFLTHTLLVVSDKIATCWSAVDKQAMGDVQWAFAEHFERLGEVWTLDTGTPGSVTRQYFTSYAPGGGPFDVATWHPGLGEGKTYADYDDAQWSLRIWRMTPDHGWQWEVSVHDGD
jgi:hypothetical protein